MEVGEKHLKIIHMSEELYTRAGDDHAMIQKTCRNYLGNQLFPLGTGEGTNLRGSSPVIELQLSILPRECTARGTWHCPGSRHCIQWHHTVTKP